MGEKIYYDFHMHTALSPCGDVTMTPNNIVNMASILELNCIAITDHNSCGNVAACIKAAENNGLPLTIIPGMELETSEEVHVVCLFDCLEKALEFESFVKSRLPFVANKPEIFGEQQFLNEEDELTGELPGLLLVAANIDLYEAVSVVQSLGGVAIPAHIDRTSYSLFSNLGFLPSDLNINLIEISKNSDPEAFMIQHKKQFMKEVAYLQSSDAHYLENISEKERYIRVDGEPNAQNIIKALKEKR